MKLFGKTTELVERQLDLAYKRHALLTGNVANAETPNYRARDLDFAGELQRIAEGGSELAETNSRHLDLSGSEGAHAVFDDSGAVRGDGNNVDLDIALGKLADNARAYSGAVNLLSAHLRLIRTITRRGAGG